MMYVSQQIESEAYRFLRELVRQRKWDKTNAAIPDRDDPTKTHVMGGIFQAKGGRDVRLGMLHLEKSDVAAFRKELRKRTGVNLSQEYADQLLSEAAYSGKLDLVKSIEEKRAYEREKKAKRRQWARDHGYCIMCCKNAAGFDADGYQLATCRDCQDRANAAKSRKRPVG